MEPSFDFRKFKEEELIAIAKDLLDRRFGLNLSFGSESDLFQFIRSNPRPDLVQFDRNNASKGIKVSHLAEVKGPGVFGPENYDSTKSLLLDFEKRVEPEKLFLILFDRPIPLLKKLKKDLYHTRSLEIIDLEWIEDVLLAERDIAEKWQVWSSTIETQKPDRSSYQGVFNTALEGLKINDITQEKRSFYVGGHRWGSDDHYTNFLEKGIWENGWEDKFLDRVNGVKEGDLIFLKATIRRVNTGYLRLKAVGVVGKNHQNGRLLSINWYEFPEIIEMRKGAHLRSAIQLIGDNYVDDILEKVLEEHADLPSIIEHLQEGEKFTNRSGNRGIKSLEVEEEDLDHDLDISEVDDLNEGDPKEADDTSRYSREQQFTQINSDSDFSSKDLLEIENDVRSFALLLASSNITPPIAIALFGKWGSGKSFFMRLLQERISELSQHQGFRIERGDMSTPVRTSSDKGLFCKGIAQIEFNAWSYLDSNLWAGLVSTIFEKLDEYIKQRGKGENEKLKIREKLSEKLQILSSEKKLVIEKKEDLENEKKILKKRIAELKENKERLLKEVADKQLQDLKAEILKKVNLEENVRNQLNDYGISSDKIQELSPQNLYHESTSWIAFLRNIGRFSPKFILLFSSCLVLLFFLTIDPFGWLQDFIGHVLKKIGITLSIVSPLFLKWFNTYKKFVGLVQPITDYKNRFNQKLDEAKFDYQKELELLKANLLVSESEISESQSQIQELNQRIETVEYTIDHFIPQKAFNNFIKRRINEKHYDKHIGLISIIRRDFEVLSDLFTDIKLDPKAPEEVLKEQKKKRAEHNELVELFKEERMLDRIILYIDDLDRCSDEKVLEVVQAVHLLMAFPLFNVVVGVDKRCIRNALLLKTKLFYRKIAELEEIEKIGVKMISPGEYLEKIFQIPFELKEPEKKDIRKLADALLKDQVVKRVTQPEKIAVKTQETTIPNEGPSSDADPEEKVIAEEGESKRSQFSDSENENSIEEEIERVEENEQEPETSLVTSTPDNLELDETEFEQIKSILYFVGNTPRTAKRYINIYRIIRAHKRPETDRELTNEDHLAIMFLLAVGIGDHKSIFFEIVKVIHEKSDKAKNLKTLISELNEAKEDIEEFQLFKKAFEKLEKETTLSPLFNLNQENFKLHIPFVKRFSFGGEREVDQFVPEPNPA